MAVVAERADGDKEFRVAAFTRGAELGARVARDQVLRALAVRHRVAVSLGAWATRDGLPSDYWDARADAFAQMIEEVKGHGRGWWS